MKTVAIIQARMSSTRLPGKVMKLLQGQTVLSHVIRRVQSCPLVDDVLVATTIQDEDDVIVKETLRHGALVYRGSLHDVLDRYHGAACSAKAETVVRVTSDCPLFDPVVLKQMLQRFADLRSMGQEIDYLSNTVERSYPRGLDAEIFSFINLQRIHKLADKEYEREHVTPYFYLHPDEFRIAQFIREGKNLSTHRWTLDTPEDFCLLETLYDALGQGPSLFPTEAVLDYLEANPELLAINAHIEQKKLGQ